MASPGPQCSRVDRSSFSGERDQIVIWEPTVTTGSPPGTPGVADQEPPSCSRRICRRADNSYSVIVTNCGSERRYVDFTIRSGVLEFGSQLDDQNDGKANAKRGFDIRFNPIVGERHIEKRSGFERPGDGGARSRLATGSESVVVGPDGLQRLSSALNEIGRAS